VGVHYLFSAPIGFSIGVTVIYFLSTRWVFRERRLSDARREFVIFAFIGLLGLLLNELIIFLGVERLALSYELAKLASAGIVFGFNSAPASCSCSLDCKAREWPNPAW